MSRVLICHRPEDSGEFVAQLGARLRERFGEQCLAPDGTGEPAGDAPSIQQAVEACAVLLLIIGPRWLGESDAAGRRWIDDPHDRTRIQLDAALEINRPIIIVLAPGGAPPERSALPGMLAVLAACRMPPIKARDDAWEPWFGTLVEWLEEVFMGRDAQFRLVHWVGGAAGADGDWNDRLGGLGQSPDPMGRLPSPPAPAPASAPPQAPAPAKSKPSIVDLLGSAVDKLAKLGKSHYRPADQRDGPAEPAPWPHTGSPASAPADHKPPAPGSAGASAQEPVLLGASVPQAVRPGSEFTARFVAYIKELEDDTGQMLEQLSLRSVPQLGMKSCRWQPGTSVEVALYARGLNVTPAKQQFVWEGSRNLLEFDVAVPKKAQPDVTVLKFDVSVAGIVVARLRLDVEISARAMVNAAPATASVAAARTAFASYSAQDRQRVLDRLAAVRINAGLDIFLDCMSLHPSEAWKPQLEAEIKGRELFLLFWSAAASESQWVAWEWNTALRARGKSAMQIHPLEVGVRPPDELKDLHFGDPYMLLRKAYEAERTQGP
jgi:hypothetical protein